MPAAQPARRRKHFDDAQFKVLYEALGKPDFTPYCNAALEHLLTIPDVTAAEKVLTLIVLQAWGNQQLFAVHHDNRTMPFTEADCARRLGLSRQRVNKEVRKWEARGHLRREEYRLYPVPDPKAPEEGENVPYGSNTPSLSVRPVDRRRFFSLYPDRQEVYQQAFKTIDSVNREIAAFVRAQVSSTGGTDPMSHTVETIDEVPELREGHEPLDGQDTSPDPSATPGAPILTGEIETSKTTSSFSSTKAELLKHGRADDVVVAELVQACERKFPDVTPPEIVAAIQASIPGLPRGVRSLGKYLVPILPAQIEHQRQREAEHSRQLEAREAVMESEPYREQTKQERLDGLNSYLRTLDPHSGSRMMVKKQIEDLRAEIDAEAKERKPADRETRTSSPGKVETG